MSKTPFAVGDRVAVYDHGQRVTGTVVGFHKGDENKINIKSSQLRLLIGPAHPKQCRKLVKKERRRVWVEFNSNRGILFVNNLPFDNAVEFAEVRKKK